MKSPGVKLGSKAVVSMKVSQSYPTKIQHLLLPPPSPNFLKLAFYLLLCPDLRKRYQSALLTDKEINLAWNFPFQFESSSFNFWDLLLHLLIYFLSLEGTFPLALFSSLHLLSSSRNFSNIQNPG